MGQFPSHRRLPLTGSAFANQGNTSERFPFMATNRSAQECRDDVTQVTDR